MTKAPLAISCLFGALCALFACGAAVSPAVIDDPCQAIISKSAACFHLHISDMNVELFHCRQRVAASAACKKATIAYAECADGKPCSDDTCSDESVALQFHCIATSPATSPNVSVTNPNTKKTAGRKPLVYLPEGPWQANQLYRAHP